MNLGCGCNATHFPRRRRHLSLVRHINCPILHYGGSGGIRRWSDGFIEIEALRCDYGGGGKRQSSRFFYCYANERAKLANDLFSNCRKSDCESGLIRCYFWAVSQLELGFYEGAVSDWRLKLKGIGAALSKV